MPTTFQDCVATLTRLYPLQSGCLKVAELSFIENLVKKDSSLTWVHVPGGFVRVHLNELIGRTAYFLGDLDKRLTWISRSLIKSGDTVLDIGANVGIMSLLFSDLVGETGKVLSFEPNPIIFEDLEAAVEKKSANNVNLFKMGLGECEGELILSVPHSNLGLGTLVRTSSEKCTKYKVQVKTLDNILKKESVTKVDFMKIDVEGFEYNVLLGAHETLRQQKPKVIVFELNNFKGKAKDQEVVKFLTDLDYKFISIPKCLFTMYTEVFDYDKTSAEIGNDVIAVRNDAFDQVCAKLKYRL